MTTPGFKTTVKLETGGGGSRLVDSATGASMALSDTEALLLEFWDGSPTPAALARAASDASLSLEPRQAAVLLARLHKAGFLAIDFLLAIAPAQGAASTTAEPAMALTDVLPRFRRDLQLIKLADGAGSTHVKDATASRSFTLFDFELSVARMLDGQRTAASVIEAAGNIGIPVTPESLRTFVAHLKAYGFLETGDSATTAPQSTWPQRRTWPPVVRALFQRALKLSRESQPREALPVLAKLLALEPHNAEAAELKARIEAAGDGKATSEVNFVELQRVTGVLEPAFSEPAVLTAVDELRRTLSGMGVSEFKVQQERKAGVPEGDDIPPPAVSAPLPPIELETVTLKGRNRKLLRALAGLAFVGVLGFFVRPVPWQTRVACVLSPTESGVPLAPREGAVLSLEVRSGAEVKKGDALAKLDVTALEQNVTALEAKVEEAKGRLAELTAEPCDARVRARVEVKVAGVRKFVDAARAELERARADTNVARRERNVKALELALLAKLKLLSRVEAEHEELTLDKAVKAAGDDVETAKAAVEAARKLIERSTIVSPADGFFMPPPDAVGFSLAAGAPFGRIVSRIAKVETTEALSPTLPLPEAKLDLEVLKRQLNGEMWISVPTGRLLEGTVEINDVSSFGKPMMLELEFGTRPYYRDLLER